MKASQIAQLIDMTSQNQYSAEPLDGAEDLNTSLWELATKLGLREEVWSIYHQRNVERVRREAEFYSAE